MGLVLGEVSFPEQPPSLEALAARITARSGLPVRAEPAASEPGWYRLHGRLSFACVPELGVEVYSYSEEQRQRNVAMFVEFGLVSPAARQAPLRPGCVVHVKSYVGVEPTLFLQTELALEDLGGTLSEPFTEDVRREYGGPITEEELRRRIGAAHRHFFVLGCLLNLLLLPIQLPFLIVGILWRVGWTLVQAPRVYRQLQQRGEYPIPLSSQKDISEGIRIPFRRRPPPTEGPT
jgi:hypothetical protein